MHWLLSDSISKDPLELPCTTGDRVYFTAPLKRDPIGNVPKSSGWRFLAFNNVALLDSPGECVCNELGDGTAQFSYIHPEGPEFEGLPVVMAKFNPMINSVGASDVLLEGLQFRDHPYMTSTGMVVFRPSIPIPTNEVNFSVDVIFGLDGLLAILRATGPSTATLARRALFE